MFWNQRIGELIIPSFHEPTVYVAVLVAGEENLPNEVNLTGNTRCVEYKGYYRSYLRRKLIDEPCEEKTEKVGYGTRHRCEYEGVLYRQKEDIVVEKKSYVVGRDTRSSGLSSILNDVKLMSKDTMTGTTVNVRKMRK